MGDRKPSPENVRHARNALSAILAAHWVLACGTADHATVPPAPEGDASASVASVVNLCPRFDGSLVLPQHIPPMQSAMLAVTATDPDGADSELVFAWSAPSGVFSDRDKPVTNYNCSELGQEQLTITAADHQGCSSTLTIGVVCIAD
jgi:hypothetical protein